jgi:hypothetical protein
VIITLFTYHVLSNDVILGTAYTAPFSKWSYSAFICNMNPFLLILLLFFCTYVFSKKELAVRKITMATPISESLYYVLKGTAILIAYTITAVVVILMSFIFYALIFQFYGFDDFIAPILLFLIPPAIFVFGIGMLLGSINELLLFIFMPLVYICSSIAFMPPMWFNLFCQGFAEYYPQFIKTNAKGEVPFLLPAGMAASRIIFVMAGVALFVYLCIRSSHKFK